MKAQANTLSHSRFGFVVGKTIDKRAVVRNRIKRVFRSIIEEKWLDTYGQDVLFILNKNTVNATRENMQKETDSVLHKIFDL